MTKTKWYFSQKTMTKTKSKFAVKINTDPDTQVQVQVNFICIAHLQQPPGWPKCFTEEQDYTT